MPLVTNGHTGISGYDDANDGAIDLTVSLASFDTDNSQVKVQVTYTTLQKELMIELMLYYKQVRYSLSYDDAGGTLTTGKLVTSQVLLLVLV